MTTRKAWEHQWPAVDIDPGREPPRIETYGPDGDTVETGLLDANGRPIHKRVRWPVGFVDFGKIKGR